MKTQKTKKLPLAQTSESLNERACPDFRKSGAALE